MVFGRLTGLLSLRGADFGSSVGWISLEDSSHEPDESDRGADRFRHPISPSRESGNERFEAEVGGPGVNDRGEEGGLSDCDDSESDFG
jgi:hypothetical protein